MEFVETAVRLSEGEYYIVVHGYTTTARTLLSTLPGLQGLGWAKYVLGSSVAAVIILFSDNSPVLQQVFQSRSLDLWGLSLIVCIVTSHKSVCTRIEQLNRIASY